VPPRPVSHNAATTTVLNNPSINGRNTHTRTRLHATATVAAPPPLAYLPARRSSFPPFPPLPPLLSFPSCCSSTYLPVSLVPPQTAPRHRQASPGSALHTHKNTPVRQRLASPDYQVPAAARPAGVCTAMRRAQLPKPCEQRSCAVAPTTNTTAPHPPTHTADAQHTSYAQPRLGIQRPRQRAPKRTSPTGHDRFQTCAAVGIVLSVMTRAGDAPVRYKGSRQMNTHLN